MKTLILLFSVCISLLSFADTNVDSLEQVLPNLKGIEKIDAFNDLAYSLAVKNPEKSKEYYEEAKNLLTQIPYPKGEVDILRIEFKYLVSQGDYVGGFQKLDQAQIGASELNDSELTRKILKSKLNTVIKGNLPQKDSVKIEVETFSKKNNDEDLMAYYHNQVGIEHYYVGDFKGALEHFQTSAAKTAASYLKL